MVLVMAYGRQDRKRILGDHGSKLIVVEAREVEFRTAASEHEDSVEDASVLHDAVQRIDYGCRASGPLHERRIKDSLECEAVWVLMQMAHEIAVSGGIFGRNYSQTVRESRKLEAGLKVHEPFLLKALDRLLTLQFLDSDGVFGIDVVYDQGQAVKFAEIYLYLDENHHAFRYRRTGHGLEVRRYESVL
jgi:hypothetical protein